MLEEGSKGTGGGSGHTQRTGLCSLCAPVVLLAETGSVGSRRQPQTCQAVEGACDLTIPRAYLIIKTHTSHTGANTCRGGIGILQCGLDPSPSKSGTSARESNTYPWIRWTPSRIRCITY